MIKIMDRNKLHSGYSRVHRAKSLWPVTLLLAATAVVMVLMFGLLFRSAQTKQFLPSELCTSSQACNGHVLVKHDYSIIKDRDVEGHDLLHVQSHDLGIVKQVCDMFDECQGFNNNGWLKTSVASYRHGTTNLYVKQQAIDPKKDSTGPHSPSEYSSMISGMKVYIYDINIGLEHHPSRVGGYATERLFAEQLVKSPFVTQNPREATFFFIPIRCSSYILDYPTEHQGVQEAKRIVAEVVTDIKTRYPYWSWSSGADHFYVCAHDVGAEIGGDVLKNAIALVNTADYDDPYFIPHKDISLPPAPSPGLSHLSRVGEGGSIIDPTLRSIFVFFAGDMSSGRIRPSVLRKWSHDPDFVVRDSQLLHRTYVEYLKKSKFCLVLRGREAWSPRLVEVLFMGCVPVIISDHYHLPLQGVVDWTQFSIIVLEEQVNQLKDILRRIPSQTVRDMQTKMTSVYRRFVWNNPAEPSDAFYSLMLQLWRRRYVVRYKTFSSRSPRH